MSHFEVKYSVNYILVWKKIISAGFAKHFCTKYEQPIFHVSICYSFLGFSNVEFYVPRDVLFVLKGYKYQALVAHVSVFHAYQNQFLIYRFPEFLLFKFQEPSDVFLVWPIFVVHSVIINYYLQSL